MVILCEAVGAQKSQLLVAGCCLRVPSESRQSKENAGKIQGTNRMFMKGSQKLIWIKHLVSNELHREYAIGSL